MKQYTFHVAQPAKTFYEGEITIEASSYKNALKKIKNMTNDELNEIVYDWNIASDATEGDGEIEVYDENLNRIK